MTDFVQLVANYGLPAIMCAVMMYYVKYREDKNDDRMDAQTIRHKDEIEKLAEANKQSLSDITQALNNNTIALQKLTDYMERQK